MSILIWSIIHILKYDIWILRGGGKYCCERYLYAACELDMLNGRDGMLLPGASGEGFACC
ncbi:hypothetical protein SAMN04515695_3369 [Pseudovibrio sp. Tun.PSC04-5.I4]|nr:hypothetical protein SAMN04515695_3369 [Pseudovibrio sp. Tun.PSC04-5.I4]